MTLVLGLAVGTHKEGEGGVNYIIGCEKIHEINVEIFCNQCKWRGLRSKKMAYSRERLLRISTTVLGDFGQVDCD